MKIIQLKESERIKINIDNLKESLEQFTPYNEQEEVERKIMLK